jgi:hypothetical protein
VAEVSLSLQGLGMGLGCGSGAMACPSSGGRIDPASAVFQRRSRAARLIPAAGGLSLSGLSAGCRCSWTLGSLSVSVQIGHESVSGGAVSGVVALVVGLSVWLGFLLLALLGALGHTGRAASVLLMAFSVVGPLLFAGGVSPLGMHPMHVGVE